MIQHNMANDFLAISQFIHILLAPKHLQMAMHRVGGTSSMYERLTLETSTVNYLLELQHYRAKTYST